MKSKNPELDEYLKLILKEQKSRPAEAKLANEIFRLRSEDWYWKVSCGVMMGTFIFFLIVLVLTG